MKKRILISSVLVTLILTGLVGGGASANSQEKQSLFVGIFKATNPDFVSKGPQPKDMSVLQQHVEYLRRLTDQGIAIVAGHTTNHDENAFGLAIVRADSESSARKILEEDALVRAGLLTVTVFPFEGLVGKNNQSTKAQPSSSSVGPETRNPN